MRAFQVTLYHRDGHAQHCLVHALVDGHSLLVDPSYGLVLCGPEGHALGVADLRAGVRPRSEPLPEVTAGSYPRVDYYDFDYRLTQTANWTMSAARRLSRRVLGAVFGERRVAQFEMPLFLEWPQHLAGLAALVLLAAVNVVTFLLR